MMHTRLFRRKRKLLIETCEPRRPLAAYINEVHFDPLFGNTDEDQYIELRSDPGVPLPSNSYLVVVQSSDGVKELGDVRAVFNLSDQAVGDNGILVLLQSAAGYAVDPQARELRGADGFLGMPGGVYQSDSNTKSFGVGSTSFLLVQSAVAPALNNDIDGNDDGVPDGAYLNWSIIDSVAVFPWGESVWPQKSYAQITFRERNVGAVMPGTTSVDTDQLAYVARINHSTGNSPDDWVGGNTVETTSNPASWKFQLQHGTFGTPRPYAYGGRILDHVGSENWVGGISGAVFEDANSDGIQQSDEVGVAGATIRATSDKGELANYDIDRITPNTFALNTDVSNASPYVTIVSASSSNVPQGFKIRVVQRSFAAPGEYIFSHEGVGFFNEDRRMRMDFYSPARSVAITVIGNSDLTPTYGRLEIFNAAGQSMGFVRSGALGGGQPERLTMSSPRDDIAWALAYPENSFLNSSPFGMLDDLEVVVPEKTVKTDANGRYVLPTVPNDDFHVTMEPPKTYDQVFPANLGGHDLSITANQFFANVNFGLLGNRPPKLEDDSIHVSELSAVDEVLGVLPVSLGYPSQRLNYSITSGDPTGLFTIDADGQIKLNRAELDFETKSKITLNILLEDVANAALNDTALLEILVDDGNEPPQVATQSKVLPENTSVGTDVTTVTAVDPDAGVNGEFTFAIVGGNVGNAFAIDAITGAITVRDPNSIDYEQRPVFNLLVRATDNATPPKLGQATITINLSNVNEAPNVVTRSLSVKENSPTGTSLGKIIAQDPDQGQQLTWSVTGGDGQSLFSVSSTTGEVTVGDNAALNFEGQNTYKLLVTVVDSATPALSNTATVIIALTDENDPPTIQTTNSTIDENAAASTLVSATSTFDQDVGQALTLSLSGPVSSNFVIDSAGNIRTAPGAVFDFEAKSKFVVTVEVADNGTPSLTSQTQLTVTIGDVNEAPVITTSNLTVPENSVAGQLAGQISGSDPDALDQVVWSLISQSQDWFALDASTGNLTVKSGANIDFESNATNRVVVKLTDKAGLNTTSTVTISATDANDPPTATQTLPSQIAKVDERFSYTLPSGLFVDPDAGEELSLFVTLASGFPLPGWLAFDAATGTLSGTPALGNAGPLQANVTAIDKAGVAVSAGLTIHVATATVLHNPVMPMDVSGDDRVTARDALLVINYLNTKGAGAVPAGSLPTDGYFDTSADNSITPRDVLLIINELNLQSAGGEGEATISAVDIEEIDTRRPTSLKSARRT